jgi:hypothetical protein
MTAVEILRRAKAAGVRLYVDAGRIVATPKSAITDELRALIRAHKPALLEVLAHDVPGADAPVADVAQFAEGGGDGYPAYESRRQRVAAMLEARPEARYALVVDESDPTYPGCVVLGVGIRSQDGTIRTCDLIVPQERHDGFAIIDLIDRHGGTLH